MRNRSLIVLLATCFLAGCSTYDAVGIPAQIVWDAYFDLKDDRDRRNKFEDDDPGPFWNPETSYCIYKEKNERSLQGSLENLFDEVEAGEEYIKLPTGEMYPVGATGPYKSYSASPTATCVAKERASSD